MEGLAWVLWPEVKTLHWIVTWTSDPLTYVVAFTRTGASGATTGSTSTSQYRQGSSVCLVQASLSTASAKLRLIWSVEERSWNLRVAGGRDQHP